MHGIRQWFSTEVLRHTGVPPQAFRVGVSQAFEGLRFFFIIIIL